MSQYHDEYALFTQVEVDKDARDYYSNQYKLNKMSEKAQFVGTGWENTYGVSISVKKEDLMNLEADSYGNIRLYVGKRKVQDEKSKATHYVKVSEPNQKASTSNDGTDSGLPF